MVCFDKCNSYFGVRDLGGDVQRKCVHPLGGNFQNLLDKTGGRGCGAKSQQTP